MNNKTTVPIFVTPILFTFIKKNLYSVINPQTNVCCSQSFPIFESNALINSNRTNYCVQDDDSW